MNNTNTNKVYDIIVIGADVAGVDAIKELVNRDAELTKSILWISEAFSVDATKLITKYPAITSYQAKVLFLDYFRQLLVVSTAINGLKFFGKNLILCSGSVGEASELYKIKNTGNIIFYNPSKPFSTTVTKNNNADKTLLAVSDINKEIIQECLKLKKVFSKILVLSSQIDYNLPEDLQTKLKSASKTITIIPGCHLTKLKVAGDRLIGTLDTYSELTVDKVLVSGTRKPDLKQFNSPLLKLDTDGYAKCGENYESELISTVYIVNEPVKNKKELTENINKIITKILN